LPPHDARTHIIHGVTNSAPPPFLALAGTPAEMGSAHGAALAPLIRESIAARMVLCRAFPAANGRPHPPKVILSLAERCLDAHREAFPELVEELEATARAADVPLLELLIQNGYTDFKDLLYDSMEAARAGNRPSTLDGCTAFAIRPRAAHAGRPLIGQTWDMNPSALPGVVVLHLAPKNKPAALMLSLAGCVGMIGFNEAGLCVCTNNLHARKGRVGVFWPFLMRSILACESLADAVALLRATSVAGGHNYLLMDAKGETVEMERLPFTTQIRPPASDWIVHTNHCLAAGLGAHERIDSYIGRESSRERFRQATEFLAAKRSDISLEDLMALTALVPPGAEHSVCMKPVPGFEMQTCAAIVMRPDSREAWIAKGRPAESSFHRFTLGASLPSCNS
jgi:isopenicillin-N N-acyltransferase-like protein